MVDGVCVLQLTYRMGAFVLVAVAAACSGAQEQDVLSTQIGPASTSGSNTSGSNGNTASSGGTSGQTSGGTSTSGATTSGDPGGCATEQEDSNEKNQLTITSCAKGTLSVPRDEEDWLTFERPKNTNFSANWSGPLSVTFWDERGNPYDIKHLPNREGTYSVQLQYDFKSNPLSGDQIKQGLTFPWTFSISFQ